MTAVAPDAVFDDEVAVVVMLDAHSGAVSDGVEVARIRIITSAPLDHVGVESTVRGRLLIEGRSVAYSTLRAIVTTVREDVLARFGPSFR